MSLDIATIFFVIIVMSFTLSAAIAVVGFNRHPELMLWSAALLLLGVAYLLLSLRGQISDWLSIVMANVLISTIYAIFSEGLSLFFKHPLSRYLVWLPVGLTALCFSYFIHDFQARIILGGLIFGSQGLLLAYQVFSQRHLAPGRGKIIFLASALLISCLLFARSIAAIAGHFPVTSLTTPSPLQTMIYLLSIIAIMLLGIGQILMIWERDHRAISDSETHLRTLFETTSDAVMMLDEKGFFDCNPATLKIFGCASKEQFTTLHPADLSPEQQPCGTSSRELADFQIAKAMRDGTNRFEWLHKRIDTGQPFYAEVLLNAMHFSDRLVLQAVVRDISERKRFEMELERQAHLDYLTGVSNRRHFMQLAEHEILRATRYGSPLSVLMMDVDHFKRINDTYGHKAGDLVLKQLVVTCRQSLREVDILGRLGGEEFAILLPETMLDESLEVANRVRQAIEVSLVSIDNGVVIHYTVSIGVTSLKHGNEAVDTLLHEADQALYQAKNKGRNQVASFDRIQPVS
ncbi:MAG: sensor domain-containing diguanylate cyclase [Methylophilaceae bacterium]|nr:sensor domain-containing diguanylate cyclase [Methylophilaceae bacterium]